MFATGRRTRFVFVAAALALLGCSSAPPAEDTQSSSSDIIFGSLASPYPESADVQLYSGGRRYAYCSGAVIAPKLVLTAGHCVLGIDSWQVIAPFAHGQTATGFKGATTYSALPFNPETVNPQADDVGVIYLDTPIQLATYPTIATSQVSTG